MHTDAVFAMIMCEQEVLVQLEHCASETQVRGLIPKRERQLPCWMPQGILWMFPPDQWVLGQ